MTDDRGPWIATLSGARFYIKEMNLCDIPIDDIAHALSMNCRYNGHISRHYSVAEHSVLLANLLSLKGASREVQFQGLMHDISEAFIPDIPRPFKAWIEGFTEYEDTLLKEASIHFDFAYPFDPRVKFLDRNIVRTEAEGLFPSPPDWVEDFEIIPEAQGWHLGMNSRTAKQLWLDTYEELKSVD
jgi:hypothetical protein